MARVLKDQPGVEAPTPNYPDGRIVDNQTLVTESIEGDIVQLFQKLLRDAGVAASGNPDNVSNGYQLLQALEIVIRTFAASEGGAGVAPIASLATALALISDTEIISPAKLGNVLNPEWTVIPTGTLQNDYATPGLLQTKNLRYRVLGGTFLQIMGTVEVGYTDTTIFTLPEGFRPDFETYVKGIYDYNTKMNGYILIKPNGDVKAYDVNSGAGNAYVNLTVPLKTE